jgi:dUTPase
MDGFIRMTDSFKRMLQLQYELQLFMASGDPMLKSGEDRSNFVMWNALALTDEIHEALAEIGWKPWATSRHLNAEAYTRELVDAFHFFMNLMMVGAAGMDMELEEYVDYFTKIYIHKNEVNIERQVKGYDGISTKCPACHREISEVSKFDVVSYRTSPDVEVTFCSKTCKERIYG